jgi:hypothetical protein
MKKIFRTLIAASVLICGFAFTSCGFLLQKKEGDEDLTLKDYLINQKLKNTENKWFKYDGEVPDIPLGLTDDSENDAQTGKLENAQLYLYYNRDKGLTVAIQAESEQVIELFGGAASTSMKLVTGNVNTYENFSVTRWITLSELAAMSPSDEPQVVSEPDKCILIGGDESNDIKIQWKKVLANIIISKLLGV